MATIPNGQQITTISPDVSLKKNRSAQLNSITTVYTIEDLAETLIGNQSGTNTGDETIESIQSKRPLKTVKGNSLEGSGDIEITQTDVGLSNVDNTSDLEKPISTATQDALDLKADVNEALESSTVADLPTGVEGQIRYVTDADTISYRETAVGGGTGKALVFFDGTNWIYH